MGSDSESRVAEYYDRDPQREWHRFDRHPFEFPVTLHYLKTYLEPRSRILDVGSGPGKYAIELAKLGHTLQLVDVSERMLELAQQRAEESGVPINAFHHGSATDLTRFDTHSQDAVLCLGPMYHLVDQSERDRAISESLRTLKPGGLIFVAFISVLGRLFDIVRNEPERLQGEFDRVINCVKGPSVSAVDEPGFTDAFFVQPLDVESLMSAYSIKQLGLFGVEGLTSQSEGVISGISDEVTQVWIRLAIETASTPAALYGSDHILYVGRKLPRV